MSYGKSLLVLFIGLLIISIGSKAEKSISPTVDLTKLDFEERNQFSLDSGWVFYAHELLSPQDRHTEQEGFLLTGDLASWTTFSFNGEPLSSFGYGTYAIQIILPSERPSLSLMVPKIFSNNKIWINNELVAQTGLVGTNAQEAVHRRSRLLIPIGSKKDTLNILIQVSNFYHSKAGITEAPLIGKTSELWQIERVIIITDMILVGSLTFIGLSFLLLYLFFWNKDKAILYFAIFCLCWGYRNLSDGYAPLPYLLDWFPWRVHVRIEYATLFLGGLMASLFLNVLFRSSFHPYYPKILSWAIWLLIALTFLLPSSYITYLLSPFFIIMSINIVYIIVTLLHSYKAGGQSRLALTAILLSLIILSFHIYTYIINNETNTVLINAGYIIVFMINSLMLGKRFSLSFSSLKQFQEQTMEQNLEIKSQAKMLNEVNNSLELKVMERTTKLRDTAKELDILLYRSSHDLKRPVSTISGLVYLGSKMTKEAGCLELLEKIEDANKGMESLISKLGKVMLIREHAPLVETVDLKTLYYKVELKVRGFVKRNDLLEFKLEGLKSIHTDSFLLQEILFQLLLNGAKWVDIYDIHALLNCVVKTEESNILIEVSDNGPGIEKDIIERVFEMYQVANDKIPGHGMGLYLVTKAVEVLKGSVKIESVPNTKTTCYIRLPFN
jgi:signal transduction histidine kinase